MNKILEGLQNIIDGKGYAEDYISVNEAKKILEHITNLKKENKELYIDKMHNYNYAHTYGLRNEKAKEELLKITPLCIMPNKMLAHGDKYAEAVANAINILEGKENYEGEKND